jgi:UDP-2,3-diacylglucosamine hydrolase
MRFEANAVYFISDTHFQRSGLPGETERRKKFIRLLESIPDDAVLFLLGDIFEFYFENKTVIHNHYFDIFCSLRSLKRRGAELHFIGGNHDSWVGTFMSREMGIIVHDRQVLFEAQGRTVLAAHGDLMLPGDWGYKFLKTVIRNPLVVALAKCVHPDVLSAVAVAVSKASKKMTKRSYEPLARRVGEYAFGHYFSKGNDTVVMGHIHYPLRVVRGSREFVILGDWMEHFSYAVLRNGRIETERLTGETRG